MRQISFNKIIPICLLLLLTFVFGQQSELERQVKRLDARINREQVRIDSLENQINIILPDLKNTLRAATDAKKQSDSVDISIINKINTIQNKIHILEDKAAYTDSTNFQILAQLVMIENKVVTLTNSFKEMYDLKNEPPKTSPTAKLTPQQYKNQYIESLSNYQNGRYDEAIKGFASLVVADPTNELADNSQYWLAECYYSEKNYKRSVLEFEKVFTFPGTDKDDDAQLKLGLAYQSMGDIEKAKEEYQHLLDYFPASEYVDKAKETLKQLNEE